MATAPPARYTLTSGFGGKNGNSIREQYTLLRDGKVSLCSLSQVAKVITEENKGEVLQLVQGLPKQEAECLAARYSAPAKE